jgi:hypothetical protein
MMMSDNFEAILEKCLARLKAGETVDHCLRDFPELRAKLEPLLKTAAGLYSIPEVSVSDDFRQVSHDRLLARIRSESKPASSPRFRIPVFDKLTHLNFRPLVPAALIVLLALVIWLVNLPEIIPSVPVAVNANEFTVSILSGIVETRAAGSASWQTAGNFTDMATGAGVRTSIDSHAVITFFDGSTAQLDPGTEVEVVESSFLNGQSAHIVLNQYSGEMWNHVIGTGEEQPYYAVQTPQVTLVAQGTSFSSSVTAGGATNLSVVEGTVQVIDKQNTEVSVAQDQQLNIATNLAAASPAASIPVTKNELSLITSSAGISSVCDPDGAGTGYLPNGLSFNQIPDSKTALSGNEQLIQIEQPVSGNYTVTVRSVSHEDITLAIHWVQNGMSVYQNKLVLPAAGGTGWTIRFNLAALATTAQSDSLVSIEPLTGKSPETVVQMPLAVQRATSLTAAAASTTNPAPASISSTKTTTATAKPATAVSPTTTVTKQSTGNTLPQTTLTTTTAPTTTTVTNTKVTTTPAAKTPAVTVPPTVAATTTTSTTTTAPAAKPATTTKSTDPSSNTVK